jgi:hypothetical protein
VEASVNRLVVAATGSPPSSSVVALAAAAGVAAREEVGPLVKTLLAADIDEQVTTPLAIIRSTAVRYPTAVLRRAGVPPVARDGFASSAFPDDIYDLSPASYGDLSADLVDLGIAWGAAKAFVHKCRHRS